MRLLVLDTALHACTAALVDVDEDGAAHIVAGASAAMRIGHAEALMPMVEPLLHDAPSLDRIVSTIGPGSFTGLRVALSAARGLALALTVPAYGVGTLAALADEAREETGGEGPVAAVLDARRDQVYLQTFGADGSPAMAPALLSLAEATDAVTSLGASPTAIGSGAALLVEQIGPMRVLTRAAPSIAALARTGARAGEGASPPSPLYLRGPDAKMPRPSTLKAA